MKLLSLFLTVFLVQLSAASNAQQVNYSVKEGNLKTAFASLKKQTGMVFFFSSEDIAKAKSVSVDIKNKEIHAALDLLLKDQPLEYTIKGNTVFIKAKTPVKATTTEDMDSPLPPPMDVHGRVVNEKGDPVAGVSVLVKGTKRGVATNGNGEFILMGLTGNETLVFSAVNIEDIEIKVNRRVELGTLTVKTRTSVLDEVQIQAYGTVTKRYNVGSITTVKAEDIERQPVSNPLQALEGRVPGLVVSQTSGLPGASLKIQIRGQNTISSNPNASILPLDNPYFIIDGVPFAPQNKSVNQFNSIASPGGATIYGNQYGGISPFSTINPNDIESIEILRDADATAIYGSRGANGVILITTKKGKAGKTSVNANVWTGVSHVSKTMPMMDTRQYLEMRREGFKNDGLTPTISTAPDVLLFDSTKNTDWKKYFLGNTAHTTQAKIDISGGSANTQFLVGVGFHRETYIFPGDFSDNVGSLNTNIHHNSADRKFQLDLSANYSYEKNNSSGQPSLLTAFFQSPNYPDLLKSNGELNWNYKGLNLSNPLAYLKQKYNVENYNLIANFQLEYKILPFLTIRSNFGYNAFNSNETSMLPAASYNPISGTPSQALFGSNDYHLWIIEPQVEYVKSISKGKLNALFGGAFQQNTNTLSQINGTNYSDDALLGSISSAGAIAYASDAFSIYKYAAVFGRLNYVWDKKYIISLNGRRDGSSRFGAGKQFGNFGSVGAGWIFSAEKFIKDKLPIISYGKIRASYGTTGNDAIGDYQYQTNWLPTIYPYQGTRGYNPQNLSNSDFSWSVNKEFESALELGFLEDRVMVNAAWFQNRSGSQLVSYSLPSQTGFTNVTQNFQAVIQNTGLEFQLESKNIKTKNFEWTTSVNLTIPRNKLVSFPGIETSSYAYRYIVGQPVNVLLKAKYDGVNDTTGVFQFLTGKGQLTYAPKNSPIALGGDLQVIGSLDPKFYGGLRNSFSFKGFQLDLFLDFKKQIGPNYLQQIYSLPTVGYLGRNLPESFINRWQKPGDISDIEKITSRFSGSQAANVRNAFVISSGSYSDASFIRFKTLSLSYSLADKYLKKIKAQGCRIYLNAQNLFTITNYLGNNPENMSFFSVPPLKTIVAGLQFTF